MSETEDFVFEEVPVKRPTRFGKVIFWFIVMGAVIGLGFFAWAMIKAAPVTATMPAAEEDRGIDGYVAPSSPTVVEDDGTEHEPVNILLMGVDTRGKLTREEALSGNQTGTRSDVMMNINLPGNKKNSMMSIMRDSWVPVPCMRGNAAKINAAFAGGGVQCAVATVEQQLDQRIDHFVVIDFEATKAAIDKMGGITIDNPTRFVSSHMRGYVFEQGPIHLDGEHALAFVRERYAFATGDDTRIQNQRLFLSAFMEKFMTFDKATMVQMLLSMQPYVTTDDRLTIERLLELADQLSGATWASGKLPTSGGGWEGSQNVVYVDEAKRLEMQRALDEGELASFLAQQ